MSALSAEAAGAPVLVPHWLAGSQRLALAALLRSVLDGIADPVPALHLEDVLTELHVAAARDAVWPAPAARVRRATGWGADVLPVRLSAAELRCVLAVPGLADDLRTALTEGTS